jgi:hypothetical protein
MEVAYVPPSYMCCNCSRRRLPGLRICAVCRARNNGQPTVCKCKSPTTQPIIIALNRSALPWLDSGPGTSSVLQARSITAPHPSAPCCAPCASASPPPWPCAAAARPEGAQQAIACVTGSGGRLHEGARARCPEHLAAAFVPEGRAHRTRCLSMCEATRCSCVWHAKRSPEGRPIGSAGIRPERTCAAATSAAASTSASSSKSWRPSVEGELLTPAHDTGRSKASKHGPCAASASATSDAEDVFLCAAKNSLVTSTSNTWPSHAMAAKFLDQR